LQYYRWRGHQGRTQGGSHSFGSNSPWLTYSVIEKTFRKEFSISTGYLLGHPDVVGRVYWI
jgi:hypothetical protein